MSNSLGFYQDSGLTTPLTVFSAVQAVDGTAAAITRQIYLGSTTASKKFHATSDPGVDNIMVTIVDAATGLQLPETILKLAATEGGLDSATAGADLSLGVEVLSGSANAESIWVLLDADAATAGLYENLSLVTTETVELAV